VEYPINIEIHTAYAVLLECCQESLQCENLNHVKFCSQPTLITNSRSRPRHEEDQAVSMVSALLKVKRDKYDHYSHHALIFVVQRHNLYRGIYCASSYEVIFILDTYRLSIAY
jgi:hypothetical protein